MDADGSAATVGESLTRDLRRIVVSTGVVTAVAYVFIRIAGSVFYGPLGLAPEDVGIGSSELLARAADLHCAVYLGTNGSTAVVVDPRGKAASRL